MHKEDFYVFSNGVLYRKSGNLVFQNEDQLYEWPINKIHSIRIYGNATITTKLIKYLMNKGIDIYFYTSKGVYLGHIISLHNKGNAQYLLSLAKAFLENREYIAKQFATGCLACMLYTIKTVHYDDKAYSKINNLFIRVKEKEKSDLNLLREIEGNAWKYYYQYFNTFLENFKFVRRSYNPPEDELNALISFLNSLLYGTINAILREIYLNEHISFLHEPIEKRSSLVYDFADIFKPYFLVRLLKHFDKILTKNSFKKTSKSIYLAPESWRIITLKYASIMKETKSSLWGKQHNASLRTYMKKEILRFRDSIVIDSKTYRYFLHWMY